MGIETPGIKLSGALTLRRVCIVVTGLFYSEQRILINIIRKDIFSLSFFILLLVCLLFWKYLVCRYI